MNVFYPRIALRHLPIMLAISGLGTLIAGTYGIVHDQISFTLSPEYFTKFKSEQFEFVDFGWPLRAYVAVIGFLATWWVGFIAGWFLARLTVPHLERDVAIRLCIRGFAVVFAFALAGGLTGALLGWLRMDDADLGNWTDFALSYGVKRVDQFVWVGYIHNSGYAGGLVGLIVALVQARRARKRLAVPA